MQSETYNKLLNYNECLVYIETKKPFADVDGYIYIAKIIRSFIENDRLWYELLLLTDSEGNRVESINPTLITGDNILSNRLFHDIEPKIFYNFANLELSSNIEYPLKATSFVIKSDIDHPLESTSRSALGSGIYGMYVNNENEISSLIIDPNQTVYKINCDNCYIIQDKEHGESITIASLHTNRYIDSIIQALKFNQLNSTDILSLIDNNSTENLVTLWNIALYRTNEFITQNWLNNILTNYLIKYINDNSLVDSLNGTVIQELPINDIMNNLGYEGLLANDPYNNGWNRGCVSYNYSQALMLEGSIAKY